MNHAAGRKRIPVTLTQGRVAALERVVRTTSTTGVRNRAMIAVMLGAGLRVSELVALRGVDVDQARGTIRGDQGKGDKDRVVPVDDEARGWLQAWAQKRATLSLNGRAPFFVGLREGRTGTGERKRGEGLKVRYVQTLLKRLAEAARIEQRVTPHILRHTYATRMLDRGFNLREVQTLLGHADVSTTQVYTHVSDHELREKVQGVDAKTKARQEQIEALQRQVAALQEQIMALAGEEGGAVRRIAYAPGPHMGAVEAVPAYAQQPLKVAASLLI